MLLVNAMTIVANDQLLWRSLLVLASAGYKNE